MRSLLVASDEFLRSARWTRPAELPAISFRNLFAFLVVFGVAYGAVMGSFGGFSGERLLQVVYSAVKVPLLLVATFLLSLPNFFVLNTLFGLRSDFVDAVRALVATQAVLTIILASMAPYTAFWYVSSDDYEMAILFNAAMFGFASVTAQFLLLGFYRPLIARNPRHRWLVRFWILLYAFVGIQMGWTLRPFVGSPGMPTRFFREGAWSNAYVVVFRLFADVLAGD